MRELVTVWNGERGRYLCIPPMADPPPSRPTVHQQRWERRRTGTYRVSELTKQYVLNALPTDPAKAVTIKELAARLRKSYYAVFVAIDRSRRQVQSGPRLLAGGGRVYWRRAGSA